MFSFNYLAQGLQSAARFPDLHEHLLFFFQSSLFIITFIIMAQSPSVVRWVSYKFNNFVFSELKAIYTGFPFISHTAMTLDVGWTERVILVSFIIE